MIVCLSNGMLFVPRLIARSFQEEREERERREAEEAELAEVRRIRDEQRRRAFDRVRVSRSLLDSTPCVLRSMYVLIDADPSPLRVTVAD